MRTILAILIALPLLSCGPTKHLDDKIQWHKYKEVEATFPKGPRPIFMYISESGCINCEDMDQYVFSRPEVAWFLNTNYYCLNLDIVNDLPVTIQGKLYDRDAFYALFTRDTPSYFFFDEKGQVKGLFQGKLDLKPFKQMIKFIHGGHFYKTTWEEFDKTKEAETDTVLGIF
jgi:thioredoxin-related protein